MPEGSDSARVSWLGSAMPPDEDAFLPGGRAPVPRVVVRADLLPGLSVVSLVALIGVPLAGVWALLAPPHHRVVLPSGELAPLVADNYHEFDALAVFALLAFAAGVVTGAVLWLLRNRRGPVLLLAGFLGSLGASWMAIQLGDVFAGARYPAPDQPGVGDVLVLPPDPPMTWVLVVQPLAFALCYAFAASWNGRDDLGRRSG